MKPEVQSFFHEEFEHGQPRRGRAERAPLRHHRFGARLRPGLGPDRDPVRRRHVRHVRDRNLTVDWILETHAHADHLSAAQHLKRQVGGRIGIGARITEVQRIFKEVFNLERTFNADGAQFDHLFEDGETFLIGREEGRVMYTPGHTPACATYVIGEAAFVGDTLFMPDGGTARADFPGGDATTLYRSIRRILELPPETRLFVCHDYQPGGRERAGRPRWPRSGSATSMSAGTAPSRSSWRCAPPATRP